MIKVGDVQRSRKARGCPKKVKQIAKAVERSGSADEPWAVARATYEKMKGKHRS